MNEYTILPLSVNSMPALMVDSVYDSDDRVLFYTADYQEVSGFPWLSFLRDSGDIKMSSNVSATGIMSSSVEHSVDILSIDSFGMQMIEDSATLSGQVSDNQTGWAKLPSDLEWLYGSRPYMKVSDLSSVLGDIREAMDIGSASEELYSFVESRTYTYPVPSSSYRSYGAYYDNTMVQFVRPTMVSMKLGEEISSEATDLTVSSVSGNLVTLSSHPANTVELTIQRRVGDAQYVQAITLYCEGVPISVYLGQGGGGLTESALDAESEFQVILDLLYSETKRMPVWAEKDSFTATREAPIWVLVSEAGTTPAEAAILLRTVMGVLEKNGITAGLTADRVYLDGDSAGLGPVTDEDIYAEYHIVS